MAGSIAKRPDGRWRARYRDERGRERSRHFNRRIDAQHWLDEVTATLRDGTYVEPKAGNLTFAQFYADWSPRQLWVPSTKANADLAVRSVPFGDLPMKFIRRSHVETWVKEVSTRWAATTVKTRFVIVRSVFRAAVADRVIAADPSVGIALPRRRKAEAAMHMPTVEEVGRLLAHADSTRVSTRKGFRAYVALCAFAGLRKGEAAAVQVGDIDFLRGILKVAPATPTRWDDLRGPVAEVRLRADRLPARGVGRDPRRVTSAPTCPTQPRTTGCSPSATDRCTTTTSPGAGEQPAPPPSSRTSGSTTYDTSTPPGSSPLAATSSPSSGRSATPPRRRR